MLNMEACAGHDVGFHVPLLLKQKNWAGYTYYINLASLTSGSAKLKQFAAGSSFVLNKRAEKATIDRLRDAFLISLHVYAQRHPGGGGGSGTRRIYLYVYYSRSCKGDFRAWAGEKKLDKKFRIRQTISCQRSSKLNSNLWLRLIAAPSKPKSSFAATQVITKTSVCFRYNKNVAIQPTADIRNYVLSNNFQALLTPMQPTKIQKSTLAYSTITKLA